MSDLSKKEMDAKIENAFHSIGAETWKPFEYEYAVRAYRFNDRTSLGMTERDIEGVLNDGWSYHAQFSCGEFVIITFRRNKAKEANND